MSGAHRQRLTRTADKVATIPHATGQAADLLAESDAALLKTLSGSSARVSIRDGDGRILYANESFARSRKTAVEQLIGQLLNSLDPGPEPPDEDVADLLEDDQTVIRTGVPQVRNVILAGGAQLHTARYPVELSDSAQGVLVVTHVVGGHPESVGRLLEDEGRISEMIARGDRLEDVLHQIALLIETQSPELLTAIMLMDSDGRTLRHGVAPRLPDEYSCLIDGIHVGEGIGSCGTAVARRQHVYVADTLSDPLWQDFRQVAADFGLRACWSIPLLDGSDGVLGTFAIYCRTPGLPSAAQDRLLRAAAQLTCIALVRNRDLVNVRRHEELVRNVLDSLSAGVVVIDRAGAILEVNTAWQQFAADGGEFEAEEPFVGHNYFDLCCAKMFCDPADAESVTAGLRATLTDTSEHFDAEVRSRARGGESWIQIRARNLQGDRGGLVIAHLDVTDRRQADERLRRAYAFRDSIISSAAEGICVCHEIDEEPGIRFSVWNDAMTRMTGYTVDEINRHGWYQTVYASPDEQRRAQERMVRMRQGEDLESEEWEIRHKNGAARTVLMSTRIITENEVEPRVLAVMHDISERKQAEQRIRETQSFTDTLLNSIDGLVFSLRPDKTLVRWNRTLEESLDYPRETLASMQVESFIVPEDRDRVLQMFDEAFHEGGSHGEFSLLARSGKQTPYYLSSRAVSVGDQVMLVCVGFDLTERRTAERQIRRLASFPELNPNPVLEFDARGNVNYSNTAATALASSLGCSDLSALQPALIRSAVRQCLSSGSAITGIEREHDGRTLSWAFYPIQNQEIVHCYVTDATDRITLEKKYRQATKMESIGRLAGGVAHDFNNLLAALFLQVETSLSVPNLRESVRQSLNEIQKTAHRAADLTRQLLLFGRQEALRTRDLELCETVRKSSRMLQLVLTDRIELQLDLQPLTNSVRADPGMLDQVLINLAINSRDAMPDGGCFAIKSIERELKEEDLHGEPQACPGMFVGLRISDEGAGIRTEHLPQIFEPFFTTKEFGKGTGLGLATVFGIVHQHGGVIRVESQPDCGTTFEVLFPAGESVSVSETPPAESSGGLRGSETILLVEDEDAVRRMLQTILRQFGYRVLEASSPTEAMHLWTAHRTEISMLITDLVMPEDIGGRELAAKLVQDKPDLRIVFTSGYSMDTTRRDLELSESRRFVSKPFQVLELMATVRQTLDA